MFHTPLQQNKDFTQMSNSKEAYFCAKRTITCSYITEATDICDAIDQMILF